MSDASLNSQLESRIEWSSQIPWCPLSSPVSPSRHASPPRALLWHIWFSLTRQGNKSRATLHHLLQCNVSTALLAFHYSEFICAHQLKGLV